MRDITNSKDEMMAPWICSVSHRKVVNFSISFSPERENSSGTGSAEAGRPRVCVRLWADGRGGEWGKWIAARRGSRAARRLRRDQSWPRHRPPPALTPWRSRRSGRGRRSVVPALFSNIKAKRLCSTAGFIRRILVSWRSRTSTAWTRRRWTCCWSRTSTSTTPPPCRIFCSRPTLRAGCS